MSSDESKMQAEDTPFGYKLVTSREIKPLHKRSAAKKFMDWLVPPGSKKKQQADSNRLQA